MKVTKVAAGSVGEKDVSERIKSDLLWGQAVDMIFWSISEWESCSGSTAKRT